MTDRLVGMYRDGAEYPQIAQALGVDEHKVVSKASTLRASGVLKAGYRKPPRRSSPRVWKWDAELMAEVARLRREGRYRKEICAETSLTERELGQLLRDLRAQGEPAGRGRRERSTFPRGPAPRLLSDDRVRELHETYRRGEPVVQLAAGAFVSVRFLYARFRALGLPTRVNDRDACERALNEADAANGGAELSWHRYELLRREHPEWPCAATVERVLGEGSWQAAKQAAGIRARRVGRRAAHRRAAPALAGT